MDGDHPLPLILLLKKSAVCAWKFSIPRQIKLIHYPNLDGQREFSDALKNRADDKIEVDSCSIEETPYSCLFLWGKNGVDFSIGGHKQNYI